MNGAVLHDETEGGAVAERGDVNARSGAASHAAAAPSQMAATSPCPSPPSLVKLGAVAIEREVGGGEHDTGVVVGGGGDGGHETGGSGGEAHVDDAAATLGGETREHGVGERRAGEPRVAADRDGQVGGGRPS